MRVNANCFKVWLTVAVLLLGVSRSGVVFGQVNSWINPNSGTWKWETNTYWSAGAPSSGESLFITNGANLAAGLRFRTVEIDSTTAGSGTMTVSNLTVTGAGAGLGTTHNSVFLNNAGTNVQLFVDDSLTISANGVVNLTNSFLTVQNNLFIDGGVFFNTGTIKEYFTCGGLFCFPSAANTIIGNVGVGAFTMTGGRWDAGGVQLGSSLSTYGTLTMAGGSITMSAAIFGPTSLNVLNGTVWLTGGDLVTLTDPEIGTLAGGLGQMIVSNGTWSANTQAYLGMNGGMGTLMVEGGVVSLPQLEVGVGANSQGALWVDNGEADISDIELGIDSIGQVTISNGTFNAGTLYVGENSGSAGTLTVAGGSCYVSSWVYVSPIDCSVTGIVNITGGSLTVTNSAHNAFLQVNGGTLTLSGGTLRVDTLILTNCAHFVRTGGTLIYSNVVLDANGDADGDGIPNGYEQSHGLDPLNAGDAALDKDGDGFSSLQEYLAGTDPTNKMSFFHVTSVAKEGNNVRVTWMMGPGKTNALQRTTGTGNGSYQTNGFTTIFTVTNTTGTTTNYLDVGAATNFPSRFYRVRLVP